MKYCLTDTSIIQINETEGVIQNANEIEDIEISDSSDFTDRFVIDADRTIAFSSSSQLYIRLRDGKFFGSPVRVNIVNFVY